jgi:ubiquinone/menaquinone biosynthesis C-methylase UbiE
MSDDPKRLSQRRFSQFAQEYVASTGHAKGYELARLVELAAPGLADRPTLALDIATGGGHTALTFAPHVGRVIATDLAPAMLAAARGNLAQQGVANAAYAAADGERLPFADARFDLVTCRIAPHHFPDPFRFVTECARVLKPGGALLIQDLAVPEDERAARYLDAFETLRDPSHNRMYSAEEWRAMLLDAGLTVAHAEIVARRAGFVEWARMQDCAPEVTERLTVLLAQCPDAARAWINPTCVGTPEAEFDHVYLIILGHKPG